MEFKWINSISGGAESNINGRMIARMQLVAI